jgi:hypothetical protein
MTFSLGRLSKTVVYALAGVGLYASTVLGAGTQSPSGTAQTSGTQSPSQPASPSPPPPPAAPTLNTDDVSSYITRVGGWYHSFDIPGDQVNHYWRQVAYTVNNKGVVGSAPAIVITVTRSMLMKQNRITGVTCSQGEVVTQTITADPRDIRATNITNRTAAAAATPLSIPKGQGPAPDVWRVNFLTTTKSPVVRQSTTIAVPTCPTQGQSWDATVSTPQTDPAANPPQTDSTSFSIEFADKSQADYLQALIPGGWTDSAWPLGK